MFKNCKERKREMKKFFIKVVENTQSDFRGVHNYKIIIMSQIL